MKMINPLHLVAPLIIASLIGCAEQKPVANQYQGKKESNADIVGGKDLKYSNIAASHIVFISTVNERGHGQICTGTFISKELILTAAHCIANHVDDMSMSFRQKTYGETQDLVDVPIEEAYKLDFTPLNVERNDMGVIKFKGGLPVGARIAIMPKITKATTSQALKFRAVGYGRNTGVQSEDAMAPNGEGILRFKDLTSRPTTPQMDNFKIDQHLNKGGVCQGDSGGPALVKDPKSNIHMVIGVASAVMTSRTGPGINPEDDCQNESMYLNMYYYAQYFDEYLKKAVDKKTEAKQIKRLEDLAKDAKNEPLNH